MSNVLGPGAIGAGIALALFGGRIALLLVLGAVSAVATGEVLRLVRARGVIPAAPVALMGTIAIMVLAHWRGERGPRLYPSIIALVLILTVVEVLWRRDREEVTRAIALTILPVLAVGVLASFVIALRAMPDGFRLVLVLVLMVVASEVVPALAAAARGSTGRVDPWFRLGTSLVGSLLVAVVVGVTLDQTFSWLTALSLGVLIGSASPVGRLAAEMIERELRAPEGKVVAPPRVLIRLDGLLLAAPVFFYAFRALAR